MEQTIYNKNLKLIALETILTSIGAGFSVATINLFWNSIGMNQTDIGFTQMMFTIILVFAKKAESKHKNILKDMFFIAKTRYS